MGDQSFLPPPIPALAHAARARFAGAALILIVAAVTRGCAARGDLWLDEIWSLRMSQQVNSPLGVLTELHHDNNHHLNTLFLRLVGPDGQPLAYRMLSILASLATVWVAYAIGRRRSRIEGWIAATLFAISFPMIVYGSEARGYALAVFFALVSYDAMDRYLTRGGRGTALLFGASSVLGLLSHPTLLYAYPAAACWWAARAVERRSGVGNLVKGFLEVHALPLAAFAAIYLVDLRHVGAGGGNPSSWGGVYVRSFSLVSGGPELSGLALGLGAVALLLAILALLTMRGEPSHRLVFFLCVLFVTPIVLRAAAPVDAVYERYFLVSHAFFLLVLAGLFAHGFRLGGRVRAVALACLVLFAVGNAVHCVRFMRFGRGSFLAAARFLRDSTAGPAVTVGSDHDWRNRLVLEFAAERIGPGAPFTLYTVGTWENPGPEWFLAHRQDPAPMPPEEKKGPSGETYRQVRVFPYGGLSGWDWIVYRRD